MLIRYGVLLAIAAIANGHRAKGDRERNSNHTGLVRRGKRPHGKDKRHAVAEKTKDYALELAAKLRRIDMRPVHALQVEARRKARHSDAEQDKSNARSRSVIQTGHSYAGAKPAVYKHAQGGEKKHAANHGASRLAAIPATVKRIVRKRPIDVVGYRRIPSRRKPQRTLSATGDRQRVAQDQRASTAAAMHNGEMVKRKIGIDA